MSDNPWMLLESLIKGLRRMSSMMFDNLGIVVQVSEIPEYIEWMDYLRHPNFFVRFYRRVFKQKRKKELKMIAQAAILNAVLDQCLVVKGL